MNRSNPHFLVLLLVLPATLLAGSFSDSVFTASSGTPTLYLDTGLVLPIARAVWRKTYGDTKPYDAPRKGHTPDVVAFKPDSFAFFWADTTASSTDNLYFRVVQGTAEGAITSLPALVNQRATVEPAAVYLHARAGGGKWLVSVIDKRGAGKLVVCNETQRESYGSTTTQTRFASMSHFDGDTFLVAYVTNSEKTLVMKKLSLGSGSAVLMHDTVVVDTGSNDNKTLNSSVAVDSSGRILVLYTKGTPPTAKSLYYKYYNRDLTASDSGLINASIADPATFYYYDDARVAAYGRGKFVAVHWDPLGVWLHSLTGPGATLTRSSARIVSKAGCMFPAVSANDTLVAVAWKGNAIGTNDGIESALFVHGGGALSLTPATQWVISDAATTVIKNQGSYNSELNVAIDKKSSYAVTWASGADVWTAIMARRQVRADEGTWTSATKTIPVTAGDSVWFFPGTLAVRHDTSGTIADSIQLSPDGSSWGGWVPLGDSLALRQNARGVYTRYRYKMSIVRYPEDSLITPAIEKITIPWDVQPSIDSLDSVRIAGRWLQGTAFGDTVTLMSRIDSLSVAAAVHDADTLDTLGYRAQWTASRTQTLRNVKRAHITSAFPPFAFSDSVTRVRFTLSDRTGWSAAARSLYVKTRNSPLILTARVIIDTSDVRPPDTLDITGAPRRFTIMEDDSLVFEYSLADSNDPAICSHVDLTDGGAATRVDSACAGASSRFVIRGAQWEGPQVRSLAWSVEDPDTQVSRYAEFAVNHFPAIAAVGVNGRAVTDGTARVIIGETNAAVVTVNDTDLAVWDSVTVRYVYGGAAGTVKTAGTMVPFDFVPLREDSFVTIIISDRFGKADTATVRYRYSWLSLDSADNPAAHAVKRDLERGRAVIVGTPLADTIGIPYTNTGNDSVSIISVGFAGPASDWLSVGIRQNDTTGVFSYVNASGLAPVSVAPGETETVWVYLSSGSLSGDGVVKDSIIFGTGDPVHPFDTVPVTLEHNDLPLIVDLTVDFDRSRPYWLSKTKRAAGAGYTFPPHATIGIRFSEAMDSASARDGVVLFSVFDSLRAGAIRPVTMRHAWSDGYKRLVLSPAYAEPSAAFGFAPPPGFFIPTDSIALMITSALTDTAKTPGGPNAVDVNRDFVRDTTADTSVAFRVDSITFTVAGVYPRDGDTGIAPGTFITVDFSGPIWYDPRYVNDSSLVVTSRYTRGRRIPFDSIRVGGSSIRFYPVVRFYADDSVSCVYRGYSARDPLGYPVDVSGDGIPMPAFDPSSDADDVAWYFKIRPVRVVSVKPDSASAGHSVRPRIVIVFSDPLLQGTFDTDTSNANRSIAVTSSFTGNENISFRELRICDSRDTVYVTPRQVFFSNDTVRVDFRGFTSEYSYDRTSNLPTDTGGTFGAYAWYFTTAQEGFYTYPNPYKPGIDRRHCDAGVPGSPCGIWFKNLHRLKEGIHDIRIAIFNMNSYPVFDMRGNGSVVHFEPSSVNLAPQWKWDTRNQRGEPVGSGIYLYVIFDLRGEVLARGKLLIVR